MSFPFLDESKELNDDARAAAGGSFIKLRDGLTHYELAGDQHAPTVVLVHGFSTPYFIFDITFAFLARSGFRVLRYDLFGRGYSDRPRAQYNLDFFVRQLDQLLEALHLSDLNLVGLSMGGPVTAAFIKSHPKLVRRHVLIDPCGARPIAISRFLEWAKIPGLGELLIGLFGSRSMAKSLASDLFDARIVEQFIKAYKLQMQYHGFKRAILSSLRNNMLGEFLQEYEILGGLRKPTLIAWGKDDRTVPFADSELILRALPQAEFHAFEQCGHIPHVEKADEFNSILLEFLRME